MSIWTPYANPPRPPCAQLSEGGAPVAAQVVNGPEDIARLKTYVKRVYDKKMDQLVLDLDGDGEVSMDEFMKVLMRDNFWNDQADVDETHLHGGAVATKQ